MLNSTVHRASAAAFRRAFTGGLCLILRCWRVDGLSWPPGKGGATLFWIMGLVLITVYGLLAALVRFSERLVGTAAERAND